MKALLLIPSCFALLLAVACGDDADLKSASNDAASSAGPAISNASASTLPFNERLIVTTNIELEVEQLRDVYDTISRTARDLGGFVAEARISEDEDDPTAFLRLRVPATRHDELLTAIRSVGDRGVQHEESKAVEVTSEYTDLASRLRNLQATESQYTQLLDRAQSIDEVLQVTGRLDAVRADIEQIRGRINLLDDQIGFATVSVNLFAPVAAATGLAPPLEVLVDAVETSVAVAHATLNGLIVLFVAGLWLIPAGTIALFIWKRLRKQFETLRTWFS